MFRHPTGTAVPGWLISRHRPWLAVLVAGLLAVSLPATSHAGPAFTVCPSGCPYSTIQAAINAAASGDTIHVGPGTYSEFLTISKPLTIEGAGEQQTIVDSTGTRNSVVTVTANSVRLAHLTVTGAILHGGGGGVINQPGATLTLDHTTVSGNSAIGGGGIDNQPGATLTLDHSTVSGNSAPRGGVGGGIANSGLLALDHSTVSGNSATGGGGGIYNSGTLTLDHSTVSGNTANHQGGGIYNSGTLALDHSTVSGNTANNQGGGIFNNGTATLTHSELLNNSASDGGAIYNDGGTVTLDKTDVQGNSTPQCEPTTLC